MKHEILKCAFCHIQDSTRRDGNGKLVHVQMRDGFPMCGRCWMAKVRESIPAKRAAKSREKLLKLGQLDMFDDQE